MSMSMAIAFCLLIVYWSETFERKKTTKIARCYYNSIIKDNIFEFDPQSNYTVNLIFSKLPIYD